MFENVDGRTMDAGVTDILIAHLGAFGSGELKNSMFRATGLKTLSTVGTHIFLIIDFSGKTYNFMHFERKI